MLYPHARSPCVGFCWGFSSWGAPKVGPSVDLRGVEGFRTAEGFGDGVLGLSFASERMSAGLACSRPESLSLYWYFVFVKPGVSVYEMLLSRPYRLLPHDTVGTWRSEFGGVHACL